MVKSTFCSRCTKRRRKDQRYCDECHAAYMREYRPKHSELSEEQRQKSNARSHVYQALKADKITKEPCCVCGEESVQAYHEDYNKPLEVIWLCRKHRVERQREKK